MGLNCQAKRLSLNFLQFHFPTGFLNRPHMWPLICQEPFLGLNPSRIKLLSYSPYFSKLSFILYKVPLYRDILLLLT